jgi:DNA invertase Pin-like site-specific DNA recombinase
LNAVIYARYSCDNQRDESIDGQIRECKEFADKNGITILRCYCDRAYSAKTDNRPQFLEMIKDGDKRLFDTIIVWKLDRFARNRYDSARYKAQLKKNGIKVVSATESISEGSEGILLESVLEGYAEYYSAELSEKVVRGMKENVLKGKFNGGTIPIGYHVENSCLAVDKLVAPFIVEAFEMYRSGYSMKEIRDYLNSKNVRTPRGNKITYNAVNYMLKNRRYIGEAKFRDIVVPGSIPDIVPKSLFEAVQDMLAINRKAPAKKKAEEDYLLTTKFYCGHCGAFMIGESGKGRNGIVHRYYKCSVIKNRKGKCDCKTIRKELIEELVIGKTLVMLRERNTIEAIIRIVMKLQKQENTTIPMLEHQLSETETAINNIMLAIEQGVLTKTTKARLDELEAMKEEIEVKLANERISKPAITEDFIRLFLERFTSCDYTTIEQKRQLIMTFINAIYLFDDKIIIAYNYMERQETVLLSDLKETSLVPVSSLNNYGAPEKKQVNRPAFFVHSFRNEPVTAVPASACRAQHCTRC